MTTPGVDPIAGPLLSSDDLNSFQSSDPNWFLNAAGETIRAFCQWHIAPSIMVTESVPISPDGTIMLPSLYVTGVESVSLNGLELDPSSYQWHQAGYIHHQHKAYFQWPLWPLQSDQVFRAYPKSVAQHAMVTYTHGYNDLPAVVRAVGLELAARAIEMPAGIAKQLGAGPNSIVLGELGIVLTDEQRRRLGPYTLRRF